jgi:hypothetical protein
LTGISIPDTVTDIGEFAFAYNPKLTSATIPDSVTRLARCAFYECGGLTSVTLSQNIKSLEYGTFLHCAELTSIIIPDRATSIGEAAFQGCAGLTSVYISDNLTTIGSGAFFGCTGLTGVIIPDSVTWIGDGAFMECNGLTIYGRSDSYAHVYADAHGIPFVAITSISIGPITGDNEVVVTVSDFSGDFATLYVGVYDEGRLRAVKIYEGVDASGDYSVRFDEIAGGGGLGRCKVKAML